MHGRAGIASWDKTAAHPLAFIVAIGICTSVTALPVLGAILRAMELLVDHVGQVALSLAAVNDAALWIALTLLLTMTGLTGGSSPRLLLLPVYFAAMFWLVAPCWRAPPAACWWMAN
jgi:Kef-type K+ transport system membrane component KefB